MATVSGHGERIETRIITYRNQKGGIIRAFEVASYGERKP